MDPFLVKVFQNALASMMACDPWHEEYALEDKLKKAWKVAEEASDFLAKKLRASRTKQIPKP